MTCAPVFEQPGVVSQQRQLFDPCRRCQNSVRRIAMQITWQTGGFDSNIGGKCGEMQTPSSESRMEPLVDRGT